MDPFNLYELKEIFTREGMLICFSGPFSHSIIEELGMAVKRYLEAEQVTKASLTDVFSVFVEQTQNVRGYAGRKAAEGNRDRDFSSGIVVIGRKGDRYVVSSGNVVERRDIDEAVARLDELRGMDAAALRSAYKDRLRTGRTEGGGAGLGLIDMSRKAAEPLRYRIRDLDDRYCFFGLTAVI